jgi:hypothetical protein
VAGASFLWKARDSSEASGGEEARGAGAFPLTAWSSVYAVGNASPGIFGGAVHMVPRHLYHGSHEQRLRDLSTVGDGGRKGRDRGGYDTQIIVPLLHRVHVVSSATSYSIHIYRVIVIGFQLYASGVRFGVWAAAISPRAKTNRNRIDLWPTATLRRKCAPLCDHVFSALPASQPGVLPSIHQCQT